MPICTTCTSYTRYLYTVYQSAHNLRLEQCAKCHSFADPYVEHDSLTLLLDLILLKRGVYRHLLYNRGTEPRKLIEKPKDDGVPSSMAHLQAGNRELARWLLVFRLGVALVTLDAFIRWSHLNPDRPANLSPWTKETMNAFMRVFVGCCVETLAFHLGITTACYIMLRLITWVRAWRHKGQVLVISDVKREFRLSLVPLTLFYSSLTKLFLLFLLTIWRPALTPSDNGRSDTWIGASLYDNAIVNSFKIFDEEQIDREWVIRNVLGGMSAGFGLRVVLDAPPIFTALIILVGWRVKTGVANFVGSWVGGDEVAGEAWRLYSIP